MSENRRQGAERLLAEAGIRAAVRVGGASEEIAIVRPTAGPARALLEEFRGRTVEACREAGFRYVALELY